MCIRDSPISGQEANAEKRKTILQYMFDQGMITKEEQEEALADDVYSRIQTVDTTYKASSTPYSYFTDELTQQVKETLMEKLGYTETQAHNLLYSGGLQIYTCLLYTSSVFDIIALLFLLIRSQTLIIMIRLFKTEHLQFRFQTLKNIRAVLPLSLIHISFDPAKLEDPSLIIYAPVRVLGNKTIVTNGDQTDTIYEGMDRQMTFEQSLRSREFEPDAPNYTPRISGILHIENGTYNYAMSILKSNHGDPSSCRRYTFAYENPAAGEGHFIHTYMQDVYKRQYESSV